tara:strand:- start:835 stop:2067 length:1233 start_codon:yes stop_codon:yes gene_type:complete
MIINKLHVKDIGLFDELNVTFNKRFNFISGPNSSGKTSILKYISLALSHTAISQFRYGENPEVWVDFFDNIDSCRVGFGDGSFTNHNVYQGASLKAWNIPPKEENVTTLSPNGLNQQQIDFVPLFISAFRKISYVKIPGMKQEPNKKQQIEVYRNQSTDLLGGENMPNVKQWLINRYFQIDKDWAVNERLNWEWLLENLNNIGPKGSNLQFSAIQRDLEPMFSVYGNKCYLEELSAGYQSILSIIFCIFDWIEGTNEGKEMLIKNTKGTVLIDELDAHLHPEWQLSIRESLAVLFPKLQFIITTHSPHLIASAKPNELLIIPEHEGILNLSPSSKVYSGWNTDQILEEIMGVKSLTNKQYAELIHQAFDAISLNSISELKKAINRLKKVSHSNDTIVESLEIKLAELKLK